jgi:hypothetical protein
MSKLVHVPRPRSRPSGDHLVSSRPCHGRWTDDGRSEPGDQGHHVRSAGNPRVCTVGRAGQRWEDSAMGAWRVSGWRRGLRPPYILVTSLLPYNSPVPPTDDHADGYRCRCPGRLVQRPRSSGARAADSRCKLMLAFFVLDQLWTLTHVPNEIVRARCCWLFPCLALFVHVLVAFRPGTSGRRSIADSWAWSMPSSWAHPSCTR